MLKIITLLALSTLALSAQPAFPSTTFTQPIPGPGTPPSGYGLPIFLANVSNVLPPGLPGPAQGGIGGTTGQSLTILFSGVEAMCVLGVNYPAHTVTVSRGCQGTRVTAHNAGDTVWVGPSQWYFMDNNPSGPCQTYNIPAKPMINLFAATYWECSAGLWTQYDPFAMSLKLHHPNVFQRFGRWLKRHL